MVFRRGRASSAEPVESAEGLALSHEARRAGSMNTDESLSGVRVPRTFRTTDEARACSCEGWRRERLEDALGRGAKIGEAEGLDLALLSRLGKRCIM